METPLLKRRLNPFLLVSTVLILSLLAGLSVLYQGHLNNVETKKKDLKQQLQEKKERIAEIKQQKTNLSTEVRETEDELQRYIDLYKTEKKQRKELQEQVKSLESQIENIQSSGSALEDLNNTLAVICIDSNNQLTSDSISRCHSHGHDTG